MIKIKTTQFYTYTYIYTLILLLHTSIKVNGQEQFDIQENLKNDICNCIDKVINNRYKSSITNPLEDCLSRQINTYTTEFKEILIEENFVSKNEKNYSLDYPINSNSLNAFIAGHQQYFVNDCESYYWYASALRLQRLVDIRFSYSKNKLKLLSKKIRKSKHKKEYLFKRAIMYMASGEYEKAKADFYSYQKEDPNNDNVTYHLAWTCELNEEYGVAKAWYKKIIKKNNNFSAILGLEITNRKIKDKNRVDEVFYKIEQDMYSKQKKSNIDSIPLRKKNTVTPPMIKGCENFESNLGLKHCMSSYIKNLINLNFNYQILDYLNLKNGKHVILSKFKISKNKKITEIDVLHDDPFIVNEIKRLLNSIVIIKPAILKGKPVDLIYSLPVIIFIQKE